MEHDALLVLVDDDDAFRESLAQLLRQSSSYEVLSYPDADSCRESAPIERTACLLVDVFLPGASGPSLVSELRAEGCSAPAIYLTGDVGSAASAGEIDSGEFRLLAKPFLIAELLDVIRSLLETKSVG